eukprot:TRINITY_DN3072_c1_g1_i2.p1 TRINITY_DN3072_c1_g1~~TRINITY_DN3072_c1_g1_i2.p1  ORF type:complete len:131 (+),score=19.06 TRINITY_DN3072_c1_g1_i2:187-579(+)
MLRAGAAEAGKQRVELVLLRRARLKFVHQHLFVARVPVLTDKDTKTFVGVRMAGCDQIRVFAFGLDAVHDAQVQPAGARWQPHSHKQVLHPFFESLAGTLVRQKLSAQQQLFNLLQAKCVLIGKADAFAN